MAANETNIEFTSDGITLSGVLHVPDGPASGERRPAFVVMHGFGGYKDGPEHRAQARILCDWGYAALRIDFRGCGESEGERGRLIVEEEVRDAIAAVNFLAAHEAVDAARIGLYGDSMGACVAFRAGTDERVAAVIGSGGFGDGARTFRAMHSAPFSTGWTRRNGIIGKPGRRRRFPASISFPFPKRCAPIWAPAR